MDFYPDTQELWVTVQERDALGDDLVPDYFTSVHQAEFFWMALRLYRAP